jgi:S-adenosyl-L-methionine hydrolase (adenosine-forming)
MQIVTLTTDFGTRDWFVGTMKGVVLGINPRAAVVDLTHEIPPGDVRAGAFALMAGCRHFPKGTMHVAVVDPGVGGPRRAIAAQTADYLFVGPDNGVLSWALARERIKAVRLLEKPTFFLKPVSRTFHGRDIFAPVAAHLSRGVSIQRFGREVKDWGRLPWPQPTRSRGMIRGEIIYIDRFGNAITNLEAEAAFPEPDTGRADRLVGPDARQRVPTVIRAVTCEVAGRWKARCPLAEFYGAVPANRLVAVCGSSGFLEIAVNGGSAARKLGLRAGDKVVVRTRP